MDSALRDGTPILISVGIYAIPARWQEMIGGAAWVVVIEGSEVYDRFGDLVHFLDSEVRGWMHQPHPPRPPEPQK
jgi:hypothetical protein